MHELIITLTARKQHIKAKLYTNFQRILYILCFFSVAWALYSSAVILNDSRDRNWQLRWTVDAVYEFIYIVVFVCLGVLWAPSKNSQRYAYSIELSQMKDEGKLIEYI